MRLVGPRGFTFDIRQYLMIDYLPPHVPLVSLLGKGLVKLNLAFVPDPPFSGMASGATRLGSHTTLASSVLPHTSHLSFVRIRRILTNVVTSHAMSLPNGSLSSVEHFPI
jgi:hypothetical protein